MSHCHSTAPSFVKLFRNNNLAASADKRKPKKVLIKYETEVEATKTKLKTPPPGVPSIYRLLKFYLLIPHSEAIVERGFSKMKLIMTKKRTDLDSKNLDALMHLSYNNEKLTDLDVSCIIDTWKGKKSRHIFHTNSFKEFREN